MSFDSFWDEIKIDYKKFLNPKSSLAQRKLEDDLKTSVTQIDSQLLQITSYEELKQFLQESLKKNNFEYRYFVFQLYLRLKKYFDYYCKTNKVTPDKQFDRFKDFLDTFKKSKERKFAIFWGPFQEILDEELTIKLNSQSESGKHSINLIRYCLSIVTNYDELKKALDFLAKFYIFGNTYTINIFEKIKSRIDEYSQAASDDSRLSDEFIDYFSERYAFANFWMAVKEEYMSFIRDEQYKAKEILAKPSVYYFYPTNPEAVLEILRKISLALDSVYDYDTLVQLIKEQKKLISFHNRPHICRLLAIIKQRLHTMGSLDKKFIEIKTLLEPDSSTHEFAIFWKTVFEKFTSKVEKRTKRKKLPNDSDAKKILALLSFVTNENQLIDATIHIMFHGNQFAAHRKMFLKIFIKSKNSFGKIAEYISLLKITKKYIEFLLDELKNLQNSAEAEDNERQKECAEAIKFILERLKSAEDFAVFPKIILYLRNRLSFYNKFYIFKFLKRIQKHTSRDQYPESIKESVREAIDAASTNYWTSIHKPIIEGVKKLAKQKSPEDQDKAKRFLATLLYIGTEERLIATIRLLLLYNDYYADYNQIFFDILFKSKINSKTFIEYIDFLKLRNKVCDEFRDFLQQELIKLKALPISKEFAEEEHQLEATVIINQFLISLNTLSDSISFLAFIDALYRANNFYKLLYKTTFFEILKKHQSETTPYLQLLIAQIFKDAESKPIPEFEAYWKPIHEKTIRDLEQLAAKEKLTDDPAFKQILLGLKNIKNEEQLKETIHFLLFHNSTYKRYNQIFLANILNTNHPSDPNFNQHLRESCEFLPFWSKVYTEALKKIHEYHRSMLHRSSKSSETQTTNEISPEAIIKKFDINTAMTCTEFIALWRRLKEHRTLNEKGLKDHKYTYVVDAFIDSARKAYNDTDLPADLKKQVRDLVSPRTDSTPAFRVSPKSARGTKPTYEYRGYIPGLFLLNSNFLGKTNSFPAALPAPRSNNSSPSLPIPAASNHSSQNIERKSQTMKDHSKKDAHETTIPSLKAHDALTTNKQAQVQGLKIPDPTPLKQPSLVQPDLPQQKGP